MATSQPPILLKSPLPAADLRFAALSFSASLSTLEETRLSLLSEKPDIAAEKLLGKAVDVQVMLRNGAKRHINGYVTRFGFGRHGQYPVAV